jgi:hypothetical protein
MNRFLQYLLLFVLICFSGCEKDNFSPSQKKHFVKFFGSYSSDMGNDIAELENGYLIIGSKSTVSNANDVAIIKTDSYGNVEWEKNYGGTYDDFGQSIEKANDGNYIFFGSSFDSTGQSDIILSKISKNGDEKWKRYFGSPSNETASDLLVLPDGFLMMANTEAPNSGTNNPAGNSDVLLIKTNFEGHIIWKTTFGGSGEDTGSEIKETGEEYLIVGSSNSFSFEGQDNNNILLIKTSYDGGLIDMTTHGGLSDDFGASICACKEGYLITGTTNSFSQTGTDMIILKVGQDFRNLLWRKEFGGQGDDEGKDILHHDNEIVAVGSNELTGGYSGFLVKLDPQGNKILENNFGGIGTQVINSIKATSDNGYVFTGSSTIEQNSMIVLTKINKDGNLE